MTNILLTALLLINFYWLIMSYRGHKKAKKEKADLKQFFSNIDKTKDLGSTPLNLIFERHKNKL